MIAREVIGRITIPLSHDAATSQVSMVFFYTSIPLASGNMEAAVDIVSSHDRMLIANRFGSIYFVVQSQISNGMSHLCHPLAIPYAGYKEGSGSSTHTIGYITIVDVQR